MKYSEAKDKVFAVGTVPDGFTGDRADVGFHFDVASGHTLVITETGCYPSPIPTAVDAKEALWLLQNHPTVQNANHHVTITESLIKE